MEYHIRTSAVDDYEKIFIKNIEQTIKKMVNNKFLLKKDYFELSIAFYEDFLITIQIEDGVITELRKNSYESFIPDSFLINLSNVDRLPPRLNRYKNLGLGRFRNEIKQSLKHGKIIANNENDAFWQDYNITLKIDQNIHLADVVN
ncbi:hypothetical protein EYB33_02885 [Lysinibacillus sphaericus]|uniref:hypothetical protein n=1 Tax=Lysinibacillus sphaericus TaxID=1421 RepID=UPI001E2C0807|nr:hypothetical protein [Lysinibacillus sphaericus]UDK95262.1 hypothetical protein EYB33_02885 [Lysinibacillus sphaericus]